MAWLDLRDRVAQLLMPWIPGTYTSYDDPAFARARFWVDSLHVGGIIVSIGSPLDIAAKVNELQHRSRLPLLIASDLEGGTAFRFNGGTPFPTNMGVGATGREQDAYEMGRITAIEGRAVGIHLSFSPVADVNNNPGNPIINTRSFGADPKLVSRMVVGAVRGMQEHGMLATVKHFPGHGDTDIDSHLALPVFAGGWSRLDTVELAPFRAAIDAGVAAVMSAHIAMPGVDSGAIRPATLSPRMLTGILRDSLHFRGLTVTDALEMGALVNTYGTGEAGVLAVLAGADILLQPTDPKVVIDAVETAVRSGRISEARLNQSVRRVIELKERLGLFQHRTVALDSVPGAVGRAEFTASAKAITARSIVLAKDSLHWVDSMRLAPRKIGIVSYTDGSGSVGAGLMAELQRRGHSVQIFRLYASSGAASYDSASRLLERNPYALFAIAVRASAWRGSVAMPTALGDLVTRMTDANRPTILVSLGSPYIIRQSPTAPAYLLAWSATTMSEEAAGAALSGAAVTGRLPIDIPPLFPFGTGLDRPQR